MKKTKIAKYASFAVAAVAISAIIGLIYDIPFLKSVFPQWISMKAVTAVSFVLSSCVLYLSAEYTKNKKDIIQIGIAGISSVILLLMLVLLLSSLTGSNFGIENLLVKEDLGTSPESVFNRPSIGTMISFVLISLIGLLHFSNNKKSRKFSIFLGILVSGIGLLAILGYFLNAPSLYYSFEWSIGMAFNTAFLFAVLGFCFSLLAKEQMKFTALGSKKISVQLMIIVGFLVIFFSIGLFGYVILANISKIIIPLEKDIPQNILEIHQISRLNGLAQFIKYYDEVLTQSARNYAFTRDKKWKERYASVEPELDRVIKEAIGEGDEKDRQFFLSINSANEALVKMEYDSISLIDGGSHQEAVKILESEEYSNQKKIYSKGMEEYVARKGSRYNEVILTSTKSFNESIAKTQDIAKTSRRFVSLFILSILIASVALGIFISNKVSNRIKKLSGIAAEISRGNLDVEAAVETEDEMGNLAESLNKMILALRESKKKMDEYSKNLQSEVSKKTFQLNSKIDELEKSKSATFNIMEDIESSNRELISAHEQLSKNVVELKTLDTQKDQFISIAAHELKTPLTSIKGFADLLMKENISSNQEIRKKYLSIIYNDTNRLGGLITNILELSKMDLGAMKFVIEEIEVDDLIKDVREQMDIIIRQKDLEPEYIIEENIPNISVDKDRIIQVISNLINNAVHYTDKGKISISASRSQDYVQFGVSDTGTGIPKESFEKIFSRFYQVDSPLTRKIGGSGLGLSICKGFVESMGGKIWFESEIGKGTSFYFTVPISKAGEKK